VIEVNAGSRTVHRTTDSFDFMTGWPIERAVHYAKEHGWIMVPEGGAQDQDHPERVGDGNG